MSKHGYMTLGDFIEALSKIDRNISIYYAFGNMIPTYFDSYRGYYEDIALGYCEYQGTDPTVGSLLDLAKSSVGEVFTGWKGGDFVMKKDTTLWIANAGCSTSVAVKEILDRESMAIIDTVYAE